MISTDSLKTVEVFVYDRNRRLHTLQLEFPPDYPTNGPSSFCALPVSMDVRWDRTKRLEGLVEQYEHVLEKYQDLWSNLDDLDEHAWVIEPEMPDRSGFNPEL